VQHVLTVPFYLVGFSVDDIA